MSKSSIIKIITNRYFNNSNEHYDTFVKNIY